MPIHGYQAIPGASIESSSIDHHGVSEIIFDLTLHDAEVPNSSAAGEFPSLQSRNTTLSQSSSTLLLLAAEEFDWCRWKNNIVCILGGMIIGYIIRSSNYNASLPPRWNELQARSQVTSSSSFSFQIPSKHYASDIPNYLVHGKSFLDSLPFEEIFPIDPRHAQHRRPTNSMLTSTYEMIIGSSTILMSTPTSSSNSPHLLYHASLSSFGLLYDPSESSNNYISEFALDYFLINSGGFDAQINQAYCGPATIATMLNSLKYARRFRESNNNNNNNNDGGLITTGWSFDLPIDPKYDPYPYATQQDVLSGECVRNTVVMHNENSTTAFEDNGIFQPPYGLNLEQSSKLLACHTSQSSSNEWSILVRHVDPSSVSVSQMRYELKSALIDPYARVMINYDRKGLGQVGGGHFSPLGAYHEKTDSFLVMDVAKYKYPPVWVGAMTLYSAMATADRCGTWDYPYGQERLSSFRRSSDDDSVIEGDARSNGTAAASSQSFYPVTQEEYDNSLKVLNCKARMRGYIILKKQAG